MCSVIGSLATLSGRSAHCEPQPSICNSETPPLARFQSERSAFTLVKKRECYISNENYKVERSTYKCKQYLNERYLCPYQNEPLNLKIRVSDSDSSRECETPDLHDRKPLYLTFKAVSTVYNLRNIDNIFEFCSLLDYFRIILLD